MEIAQTFKCHFTVCRIDEKADVRHQQNIKVDTRKKPWAKDFKRGIRLLLFKDHYMLYQNIPATVYYLEHMQEIDEKYKEMDIKRRALITNIKNNKPTFSK